MTEPTNSGLSPLDKKISVLERKVEREKKARKMAERQLEDYSLKIYETNRSLQSSLALSRKKQGELEYLGEASAVVVSEVSVIELLTKTVSLTGHFFEAECGFSVITKNGQFVASQQNELWNKDNDWQANVEFIQKACDLLPLGQVEPFDSWLVSPLESNEQQIFKGFKWQVYVNFKLNKDSMAWIVFFSAQDYLDEESLYVLETARGHLVSGIRRRLTDARIIKRTIELQDTVNDLERAKRQILQSEKMASLGQLAAGVAHEINNPIAFISSNTQVLNQYFADYQQMHQKLEHMLSNDQGLSLLSYQAICTEMDIDYINSDIVDLLSSNTDGLTRVKEIVDNMKTFSHAGNEILSETCLCDCVEAGLKIARNVFTCELTVDNQLLPSCPVVMGNFGQLQQVFVNLFVNAAYAMDEGGTLSISQTPTADSLIIHVADTGRGMDEKTLNQLFTPFFTTKPVGVGTGLGLSVSYAILEAHGAKVQVDSRVGEGTTFNLSFPIIQLQP